MQSEVKNRNGRLYPFEVLDKEVTTETIKYLKKMSTLSTSALTATYISHSILNF